MQCDKSLWLYRNKKELQDEVEPDVQARFDQGNEVGVLARQIIPGGVLIELNYLNPEIALADTKKAIDAGATTLYEAAFLHDGVLVRVDVMAKGEHGWSIYEIKGTTKVEPHHLYDAAIQRYVVDGSGINILETYVVHLNSEYVRKGELDLKSLFMRVEVTEEVGEIIKEIPSHIEDMKVDDGKEEPPYTETGPHCKKPHTCSFYGHCWSHVPEYSVFNLAGARMDKKIKIWNAGAKHVKDIPDAEKMTLAQKNQRTVDKTQNPIIDVEGICKLLALLVYPIYHLDFETLNEAIPPYDGTRPFQQIPFQASIHVQGERGGDIVHHEFLGDGTKDPRPELADFLVKKIRPKGSVIAYWKSFEGGRLKELASDKISGRQVRLLDMESRLWDLADPFRKGLYVHPKFLGKWSIKNVLPALVPEMTYEGLAIADGIAAMLACARLMKDDITEEERQQIMTDLKIYCGQDTIAMVKILEKLYEVTK